MTVRARFAGQNPRGGVGGAYSTSQKARHPSHGSHRRGQVSQRLRILVRVLRTMGSGIPDLPAATFIRCALRLRQQGRQGAGAYMARRYIVEIELTTDL